MSRKLVTVQIIREVIAIEGADAIELVTYEGLGWQNVVKKGDFKAGDFAVYAEIDSLLPRGLGLFDFLGEDKDFRYVNSTGKPCFRLKSKKMRGALSQGLALPLKDVFDLLVDEARVQAAGLVGVHADFSVGSDLSEALGIEKWEPEVTAVSGATRSTFPSHILSKTDEDRLQSNMKMLEFFANKPYSITQKADGSSLTALVIDNEFHVCSRNQSLTEGEDSFWKVARKYDLERICRQYGVAIQGELVGPGIQGNKLGLKEVDLQVFSIFETETHTYLGNQNIAHLCELEGLTMVPVVTLGGSFDFTYPELQALADAQVYPNGSVCEGIVIRLDDDWSANDRIRPSFKVISNRFLLKTGE